MSPFQSRFKSLIFVFTGFLFAISIQSVSAGMSILPQAAPSASLLGTPWPNAYQALQRQQIYGAPSSTEPASASQSAPAPTKPHSSEQGFVPLLDAVEQQEAR